MHPGFCHRHDGGGGPAFGGARRATMACARSRSSSLRTTTRTGIHGIAPRPRSNSFNSLHWIPSASWPTLIPCAQAIDWVWRRFLSAGPDSPLSWQPNRLRTGFWIPVTQHQPRVLADREREQQRLEPAEHLLRVKAVEVQRGLFGPSPGPSQRLPAEAERVFDLPDDGREIEVRVDLRRQAHAVEVDGKALLRAKPDRASPRLVESELRSLRCARFLEHAYRESDRRVEVREVKLDLCELDFTELGELGAAAIDLAELRGLQRCLQRIFVALSSRDGFNGFP